MNSKNLYNQIRLHGITISSCISGQYQVVGLDIYQTRINESNKAYDRTLELDKYSFKRHLIIVLNSS